MRPIDADELIDELSLVYDIREAEDEPYNIGVMAAIAKAKQMPTIEPIEEMIKEYCRKRCLCIVTADLFERWKHSTPMDVPDRKVGKWYDWSFTAFDGCTVWHRVCSVCGYKRDDDNLDKDTPYCPNCGARMERSEE